MVKEIALPWPSVENLAVSWLSVEEPTLLWLLVEKFAVPVPSLLLEELFELLAEAS